MSIRLKKILFGMAANVFAVLALLPRVGSVPAWLWALELAVVWWVIANVMERCFDRKAER